MKKFKTNPYLKTGEGHQLARSLNVSAESIEEWYRNRRSYQRKKGLLVKGECVFKQNVFQCTLTLALSVCLCVCVFVYFNSVMSELFPFTRSISLKSIAGLVVITS